MDIKERKKILRKEMKLKFKALSPDDFFRKSAGVLKQLRKIDQFMGTELVLAFVSMKDEIQTDGILRYVLSEGKRLAVPLVVGDDLEFYEIRDLGTELAPGAFGILEPVSGSHKLDIKTLAEIDSVILVPGLAFDRDNYRLGRGKGFYDRFFSRLPENVLKIGIGYDFQKVDTVPREQHDCPLDMIITG
ncbi:MAG: 5-formyltetrahydrofolate cyclo-ligase [Spirochaetia bacterium]|nr:5-formyltetrahydrofolate cyclo-ligase [Spirochaetia bacterium]